MARILAFETGAPTDDDAASLFELVTERFRNEAFSLLSECRAYLEEADLPRIGDATDDQLLASREAHRVAVRLKDLMTRTLSLHAWSCGKISTNEAFGQHQRLQFRDYCLESAEPSAPGLPERMLHLCEDSLALYERTCNLEDTLLDLHGLSKKDQTEAA
ncbi:hypothetical protein CWS72_08470 [Telmatospirillum siberiense]|uniref:Uncharacterized protein n=2 Tax=Telmatospirillum siberiense TaxID=382514 RepID=A0A2N3PWW5_9PROT|nr:hypothetical protein CWS72_08470 [Telmatospirillum siberiense]